MRSFSPTAPPRSPGYAACSPGGLSWAACSGSACSPLLGLPPFSLFASELAIARAGIADGLGWAVAIALALMLVVFAAVVGHAQQHAARASRPSKSKATDTTAAAAAPLVAGLVAVALLGVSIWPIERLLHAAAKVVTG